MACRWWYTKKGRILYKHHIFTNKYLNYLFRKRLHSFSSIKCHTKSLFLCFKNKICSGNQNDSTSQWVAVLTFGRAIYSLDDAFNLEKLWRIFMEMLLAPHEQALIRIKWNLINEQANKSLYIAPLMDVLFDYMLW